MYQQNYNYYPQPQQQPSGQQPIPNYLQNYLRSAQPQVSLKGRLVSSLEEARATSIDFDGSVFYFPDFANRRIYTKQINLDGTATLNVYELREMPVVNEQQSSLPSLDNYITRDEFNKVMAQFKSMLNPEQPTIKQIEPEIEKPKIELNF